MTCRINKLQQPADYGQPPTQPGGSAPDPVGPIQPASVSGMEPLAVPDSENPWAVRKEADKRDWRVVLQGCE